jgi:hypothetical protein
MLIWVMPWLIIRALYFLADLIVSGVNTTMTAADELALELATDIVSGACWCGVLYGFMKTVADPGPWDWSHMQNQQPQMAPTQPNYFAPPSAPPQDQQGWWGQNNIPQQHMYQPDTTPYAKA